MKKIILIVPDTIDYVVGTSRNITSSSEEVTIENIKKALCERNEYHQYYYFKSMDEVNVVSVEDYEE